LEQKDRCSKSLARQHNNQIAQSYLPISCTAHKYAENI
jgi:hypothetical protein